MNQLAVGKTNPFLAAYCGMIPKGPVLFLGAGGGTEIVYLAAKGYAVCVFEQDAPTSERAQALATMAGVGVHWQHQDRSRWRLGFERWAGIIALFPKWNVGERRRLMAAVPNALAPNGSFLFEGYAEGPSGPRTLDDEELDPEDFRAELDILHLARFATVSRPVRQSTGESRPTWVLQVVGTHFDADGYALEGEHPEPGPAWRIKRQTGPQATVTN
jgi:hypothetical protein